MKRLSLEDSVDGRFDPVRYRVDQVGPSLYLKIWLEEILAARGSTPPSRL